MAAAAWALRPLIDLSWAEWGEDSVAFEARSGQMLRFDALTAAVIGCLELAPASVEQICDDLQSDLSGVVRSELHGAVSAILEHVADLGWIHPAPEA